MRRFALAMIALFPVSAGNAETLWTGNAQVIAVTPACADTAVAGDFFRAVFRPMGASLGNGADSHLALFSQRSSFTMRVPNNMFRGSINYVGQTVSSRINVTSKGGGILSWQESAAFGAPVYSNVTASIANFFGTTSCTATMRIGLVRVR